jgi:hypothetical protein
LVTFEAIPRVLTLNIKPKPSPVGPFKNSKDVNLAFSATWAGATSTVSEDVLPPRCIAAHPALFIMQAARTAYPV